MDRRASQGDHIAVLGLGKLGLPLTAAIASRGYTVSGWDVNPEIRERLLAGECPIQEPDVEGCLDQYSAYLQWPATVHEVLQDATIVFIIVPTPSTAAGDFDAVWVRNALADIWIAIDPETPPLVVIVSTLSPGTMGALAAMFPGLPLVYNPEFIALGSVIHDLLFPDFVLIGEAKAAGGDVLQNFYERFLLTEAPISRLSYINAELAKLCLNAFVTTKISFSHEIGRICEGVPGADANVVLKAIGQDRRIGRQYLQCGPPFGGPCFPRDGRALRHAAEFANANATLSEAVDQINQQRGMEIIRTGKRYAAVLGLAYKPGTSVTEESFGMLASCALANQGWKVFCYDPLVKEAAREALPVGVHFPATVIQCVAGADLVIVATPCPEFASIPPDAFQRGGNKPTLIDCWGMFDKPEYHAVTDYRRIGRGPDNAKAP